MKLEWLPLACSDRDSQIRTLASTDPWRAIEIDHTITTSASRLEAFPLIGNPGRVEGTREMPVIGSPFLLVYRPEPGGLLILRVLTQAEMR